MAQVAAVLAFVISLTTFLAAQDDETGRCPKVGGQQVSRLRFSDIIRLTANSKDFSLTLEMTAQEFLPSPNLPVFQSPVKTAS